MARVGRLYQINYASIRDDMIRAFILQIMCNRGSDLFICYSIFVAAALSLVELDKFRKTNKLVYFDCGGGS
jgi:hypothetical protein